MRINPSLGKERKAFKSSLVYIPATTQVKKICHTEKKREE